MPYDGSQLNSDAAHLLRAKQYIETHGWRQNSYGIDGGKRCAVGAILSTRRSPQDLPIFYLDDVVGESITYWNDFPDRTLAEVIGAFDRAIVLAMMADA